MFPLADLPQLEQIRRQLWVGREYGRAAVMVGAGFSLNAEARFPGAPPFPLWRDLARHLYIDLYPRGSETEQEYELKASLAAANTGVLRLAYEYEVAFGRNAVDFLLGAFVPDAQYRPGKLHRLLLSLPWSDVFTTNYDTLLERAKDEVHDRKYDVVLQSRDFPSRMKPRIIKLHGSLPSTHPLILTEEDYRRYPIGFAPLVNAVQQSLMENAFVLLGFSGDDPNFLQWIGWVRDRLAASCPPVYLCGILELSSSRRRLLESLNVVPVDLASLFPKTSYPDPRVRHGLAAEWFLLTLLEGKPPDFSWWPNSTPKHRWDTSAVPEIPPGPEDLMPEPAPPNELLPGDRASALRSLSTTWRHNRLHYPGWVVTPTRNRIGLRYRTDRWIGTILAGFPDLLHRERLALLYELIWRLERSLVRLESDWVDLIVSVLRDGNPEDVPIDRRSHHLSETEREMWQHLALTIVRRARQEGHPDFHSWSELLEQQDRKTPDVYCGLQYERCLDALGRGDYSAVDAIVKNWHTEGADLYWAVRKAGVFAEIGDVEAALALAEPVLVKLRDGQRSDADDIGLLSREAWTMWLLETFSHDRFRTRQTEFQGRWAQLAVYDTVPYELINAVAADLERPKRLPESVTRRVDPFTGRETVTHHWFSEEIPGERPGFGWIGLSEQAGLPQRVNRTIVGGKTNTQAATDIAPFSIWFACFVMLRGMDRKAIEDWFDRVRIAVMPQELVDVLYDVFKRTLDKVWRVEEITRRRGRPSEERLDPSLVDLHSLLLGRIVLRIDASRQLSILDLIIQIAQSARFWPGTYDESLWTLFDQIMQLLPWETVASRVGALLNLPVAGADADAALYRHNWPELGYIERWQELRDSDAGNLPDIDSASLDRIIEVARNGTIEARIAAFGRLMPLARVGRLPEHLRDGFTAALFSRTNAFGLPLDSGYRFGAFLQIEWLAVRVVAPLRRYLLEERFRPVGQVAGETVQLFDRVDQPYADEWLYLGQPDPSGRDRAPNFPILLEEIKALLQKLHDWWHDIRVLVAHPKLQALSPLSVTPRSGVDYIIHIVARVVLPRAHPEDGIAEDALALLDALEAEGFRTTVAAGQIARLVPERTDEMAIKLGKDLSSRDEQAVDNAAYGVSKWLGDAGENAPEPPQYLLDALIAQILARRQPGLVQTLGHVVEILNRRPEVFSPRNLRDLCFALDFLFKETEFLDERSRLRDQEGITPEFIYRLPRLQLLAVKLAFALDSLDRAKMLDLDRICLDNWRQRAMQSTLPEIRIAWGAIGEQS